MTEYLRQEGADGALEVKESGLLKWISFGVSETAHLVRNAKLDDGLWDDGQGSYGDKLVHVFAPLAGVTDQTLAEIRDLYEMAGMVGQVWDNPRGVVEDLYGFYEQLSVDAVKRMVSEGIRSEIETLSTPGVQRQYKLGGYVVQAVVAIAAITKEGGELILDFAERFGQKADNIRDFVGNFTQELGERFQLLSPEQKGAFFEDFGGNADAVPQFNERPGMVESWERMGDHPNKRNLNIVTSRRDFDDIDASYAKNNPFTGSEMFDMETGGFVTVHPGHNVNLNDLGHRAEFTVSESWARDGKQVTLLDESDAMGVGVARPDAFLEGIGTFDVKNIDASVSNLRNNVRNKILDVNRQADNIALNLADVPNVNINQVNQGISDALETPSSLPSNICVVYPNGTNKILSIAQIQQGAIF